MEKKEIEEIAHKINNYLNTFEKNKEKSPSGKSFCYGAEASYDRKKVRVTYISYQGSTKLTPLEAQTYLKWLEDGNIGSHFSCFDEVGRPKEFQEVIKQLYFYKNGEIDTLDIIKETEKTYTVSEEDYRKMYMEKVLKSEMDYKLINEDKETLKVLVKERLNKELTKLNNRVKKLEKQIEEL